MREKISQAEIKDIRAMHNRQLKVIYVAGFGRSGSTILGNILGQLEGFFHAGEIFALWYKLPEEEALCGCRVPIRECEVWRKIFLNAFGNLGEPEANEILRSHAGKNRSKYLPLMLLPGGKRILQYWLEDHLHHVQKLYHTIRAEAGAKVIIDSSKLPSYGYILGMVASIDLYVVHLIRDARAVTYSWLRENLREDTGEPMSRYSSLGSALRWDVQNLAAEMLWRRSPERYLMLRYEDFVRSPSAAIQRVLDLVSEKPPSLPLVNDHVVRLGVSHTVDGNPSRIRTGDISVRLDHEWSSRMRLHHRVLANSLTWPLLVRYGYSLKQNGKEPRRDTNHPQ